VEKKCHGKSSQTLSDDGSNLPVFLDTILLVNVGISLLNCEKKNVGEMTPTMTKVLMKCLERELSVSVVRMHTILS
jgi:hypothetical protein